MPKPEATVFREREDYAMELHFTDKEQENIHKALKRGIYMELHKRNMLTDAQLNELIGKNT